MSNHLFSNEKNRPAIVVQIYKKAALAQEATYADQSKKLGNFN